MRENRIKRQLQAGQTAIAVSGHHNADMVDFLGQFGFDGVWLEGEHGPVDWDAIPSPLVLRASELCTTVLHT